MCFHVFLLDVAAINRILSIYTLFISALRITDEIIIFPLSLFGRFYLPDNLPDDVVHNISPSRHGLMLSHFEI